ncbi:trigger factor [Acetobacter fallax]|uniref:Trigger factor n=1 Tax=Acetobacter fallax TaxID=1737473 RepID=A0ABX0K981_9PROT|nr:trigger factor [Acetobacter fallax]NHO31979.1 trigger factor [Acetobacter fallax]NHO35505.1 trigger factor [Acetobacter fallax]
MQVTETLSEGLKRAFTVVVPSTELESKETARLQEVGRSANLPGFRPGKVPLAIVRQRFGASVKGEVLEQAVSDGVRDLLQERGLRPAQQPKVDLVSGGDGKGDLEFKVDMEVLPEIAEPDLSDLSLVRLKATPDAATVDKALNDIAKRQREFADIEEERAAESGDVVVVDFVGKRDGVPFDGGTAQDVNVEIGGEGFIPGFAEQLEGMKPGEERQISVTFPEDYSAAELAGQVATFDITAKGLKRPVDVAVDDDLAKKIGFENLDKIREVITKQVADEYEQLSRLRIKRDLLDELAKKTSFPAPESMVEAEFEQIWARVEADRKAGELDDEDKDKDEETLKADYRKIAERRVKLGLLLADIGRVKGITVTPDEMARAIRSEAMRYRGQEQAAFDFFMKNPQAAESLRGPIFENKVVDYLIELAKVEDKEVTPEELADMPPASV